MPGAKLEIKGEGMTGNSTQILLNGEDISKYCYAVSFSTSVGDVNTATIGVYVDQPRVDARVIAEFDRLDPKRERTSFASRFREWFR